MQKNFLYFLLPLLFLFSCCHIDEKIEYRTTVIFEDGSRASSSGHELERYVKGKVAWAAWYLVKEKYYSESKIGQSSIDDFRFQCWGEGTFSVKYDGKSFTVVNEIDW